MDGASHFEPGTFRAGTHFRRRNAFDGQHGLGDKPHLVVHRLPITMSASEVRAAQTKGARSNGARVGRGGRHRFSYYCRLA